MATCSNCRKDIAYDANPCPYCGKKNPVSPPLADDNGVFGCWVVFGAALAAGALAKRLTNGADEAFLVVVVLTAIFALIGFWVVGRMSG